MQKTPSVHRMVALTFTQTLKIFCINHIEETSKTIMFKPRMVYLYITHRVMPRTNIEIRNPKGTENLKESVETQKVYESLAKENPVMKFNI